MTPDDAMRMSTEQLRRELERLRKADEDQHVGDIAVIVRELHRRDLHGGDHDIDFHDGAKRMSNDARRQAKQNPVGVRPAGFCALCLGTIQGAEA